MASKTYPTVQSSFFGWKPGGSPTDLDSRKPWGTYDITADSDSPISERVLALTQVGFRS